MNEEHYLREEERKEKERENRLKGNMFIQGSNPPSYGYKETNKPEGISRNSRSYKK